MDLLGEMAVGGKAVHTNAQHLGVGFHEFGEISLIRL
jgi:hypothetical protein